jgi:hypothetical protein
MTEREPPGSPEQPFWGIQQDAEKIRQPKKNVIWFVWSIWFVWFFG